MRLRPHQVAHQSTERSSLQRHSLRLVDELPVNSLACAELDSVLLVEAPERVRGYLAVHVILEELDPLGYTVGRPCFHHLIREQHLLHILAYAPEMPRLLLLREQRVHLLAASDEMLEHPVHSCPRNAQLVTHLPHCANLPAEPVDRAIASHDDTAAVSVVEPLVQLLVKALGNAERLLWTPPGLSVSKEGGARKLEVREILPESEVL